ncbi:MAG: DUF2934 domain-containing protein [Gammaproteobacteria bacterium]|nr:DUF2934 domain-containing protein [Gammaproteobacteria bacterium]
MVMSHQKQAPRRKTTSIKGGVSETQRERMIREAAYYLAEHRGFVNGEELSDWLAAEEQIDTEYLH